MTPPAAGQPPGKGTRQLTGPEPLDRSRHFVDSLDCGVPALDRWQARSASQAERRDATRTYVIADVHGVVVGYVTLVAGQVVHGAVTDEVGRGMSPHFPIPVAIIARLAVDRSLQGIGVGAELLAFGLGRCLSAGVEVGMRAVIVDAFDERAANFYRRFGFKPVAGAPGRLVVPLAAVRRAFSPPSA